MDPALQPITGAASASYEDFVGVSAAINVYGWEAALRACRLGQGEWTEISGHWTSQMSREMQRFAGHPQYLGQEEHRLRSGGQPRQVQIMRVEQAPAALTSSLTAGSRVAVNWSDGNQYPAQVLQVAPGQLLVAFDNGSQQWVPEHAVRALNGAR